MANKSYRLVRLVPELQPETGTVYTIKKPTKGLKAHDKMRFRKLDPVLRKHVWFVEKKMPSHS